jgi:Collagen triple helix repeat (20 copies)
MSASGKVFLFAASVMFFGCEAKPAAQGPVGERGAQGAAGMAGMQGSMGSQGAMGAQGAMGLQGAMGAQGAMGSQGAMGTPGAMGSQGAMGTPGVMGSQGLPGAQGPAGAPGPAGPQGPPGVPGTAVSDGGVDGTSLQFFVKAINDSISPISFKKALYTAPYTRIENAAFGNAKNFPSPSIFAENEWDWTADGDVWTNPVSPDGATKVYARITISAYNPTNHQPCLWLRREFYDLTISNFRTMTNDPDIKVGCFEFGYRRKGVASATLWVPWWATALTKQGRAGSTQRLLLSMETDWAPETVGTSFAVIYAAEIELFASHTSQPQLPLVSGGKFETTGASTGFPITTAVSRVTTIPPFP